MRLQAIESDDSSKAKRWPLQKLERYKGNRLNASIHDKAIGYHISYLTNIGASVGVIPQGTSKVRMITLVNLV